MTGTTRRPLLDFMLVLLLVVFGFSSRQWHLGLPETRYFDETYYSKSGEELLNGKPDSNTVHPPLAKLMIATFGWLYKTIGTPLEQAGWVGGVTDFARWRVGSVVMGLLTVPLTYGLAFRLFRNRWTAVVSCFLLDIDFLHVVQSRVTMLDMYVCFFILLGAYASFRFIEAERKTVGWAVLSVLSFAIGFASKWSAMFAAFGAVTAMLTLKPYGRAPEHLPGGGRKSVWIWLLRLGLLYVLIVPLIYLVSFVPFFWQHHWDVNKSWTDIKANHKQMLVFRYSEEFKHRYMSRFWAWPTMLRPVWYHYEEHNDAQGSLFPPCTDCWPWDIVWRGEEPNQYVTGILAMGSPFVWWTFLIFLLLTVTQSIVLPLFTLVRARFRKPSASPGEQESVPADSSVQPDGVVSQGIVTGTPPPGGLAPWRNSIDAWRFGVERPWLFLMLMYFPQILLWSINRGFLFYMLPCVPFMCIFIAEILREWLDLPGGRLCACVYLTVATLCFVAYYPLLAGWSIPKPIYQILIFTDKWV